MREIIVVCDSLLSVAEVEQLLEPEERAIFEQNEAPNLDKLSTVS